MSVTTASTSTSSRGSLLSDEEASPLIPIWGEANVQEELDGAVRNKAVYQARSCKSKDATEWEQCKRSQRRVRERQINIM